MILFSFGGLDLRRMIARRRSEGERGYRVILMD